MSRVDAGTVIDGRWRLDALAGEGGMGSVHRATDLLAGGSVAVKLTGGGPAATDVTRFVAEAGALATVRHDDVVRYVAHGVEGTLGPYLVMEWVPGTTLHERLAGEGMAPADALRLAARLVRALVVVHAAGIVHRDVKPRNVMLTSRGPKLVDFGVARVRGRGGVTVTGALLGTPRYMAPEQIRSARRVDGRADVFAVGCLLFEALTGRRVFDGDDDVALLARVLIEDARPPSRLRPELPRSLDAITLRLLARDPRRRPEATEALAAELDAAAASRDVSRLPGVARRGADLTAAVTEDDEAVPASVLGGFVEARAPSPPSCPGAFVGRADEVTALLARIAVPHAVVSSWGAVGLGKTRVALEVARATWSSRDTVVVDASDVRTTAELSGRVSAALGVDAHEGPGIARALEARGTFLVIDGVDGLDPGAVVGFARDCVRGASSGAATGPSVLLVARARLLGADAAVEIAPLDPDATRLLFRTRAAELSPLRLPPSEAALAAIVTSLAGSPLLVELAASRLEVLGPEGLAEALARPLVALEGGKAPGYRATLGVALRSLWEAEAPEARVCLVVGALFAAPFALGAAAEVAEELGAPGALATFEGLRHRGMLVAAETADGPRFLVAPALRPYARESDPALAARAAPLLGRVVVARAEALAVELARSPRPATRRALAALAPDLAVIATSAAHPLLSLRALVARDEAPGARETTAEQLASLERAEERAGASGLADARLLVEAGVVRGRLLARLRRDAEARAVLLEAAARSEREGVDLVARATLELGVASHLAGDLASARASYEAVLALGEVPLREELRALGNLGAVHHDRNELAPAYARYVEAIALAETIPDPRLLGVFLGNLAVLERDRGHLDKARARLVRALAVLEPVADVRLSAMTLANLGFVELERGRLEEAILALESARSGVARVGDVRSEALTLARLAAAEAFAGREEDAAKSCALAARAARGDVVVAGVAALAAAAVDLVAGDRARAAARLGRAEEPLTDGRTLLDASDDARALARMIRARL